MIRLVGLTAAGVLFLFTKITLLLGLLVLGLVVVILFAPGLLSFGARNTFRGHNYLRDALTYGVNDQKLWVKGARIDASVPWSVLGFALNSALCTKSQKFHPRQWVVWFRSFLQTTPELCCNPAHGSGWILQMPFLERT